MIKDKKAGYMRNLYLKENIKAIIFDMDGTIISSEHVWNTASLDLLHSRGFTNVTLENQNELYRRYECAGNPASYAKAAKEEFNLSETLAEIMAETQKRARLGLADNLTFIEGFAAFHAKLNEYEIKSGIATNCDLECFDVVIKNMNLKNFFGEHLYSADHVGKAKPDPAVFLHTAKKLGVDPRDCIVFEDSISGFKAASAAGMRCIAIKNNLNEHILDQVHDSCTDFHEAEDALMRLIPDKLLLPQPSEVST
jgi:beta-phosphoglucomutase-like phosphatase (HAD superfamily)